MATKASMFLEDSIAIEALEFAIDGFESLNGRGLLDLLSFDSWSWRLRFLLVGFLDLLLGRNFNFFSRNLFLISEILMIF